MFQSPSGQGQCDWLQFLVRIRGQQCGLNYDTHIQYVFVERSLESKHDSSMLNPLHPDAHDAKLDRKYVTDGMVMTKTSTAAWAS